MSFIKKKFSLDQYKPFDKVIDNKTLAQIHNYNNIIEYANAKANEIINQARENQKEILDQANQKAQEIVYEAQQQASKNIQRTQTEIQNMLDTANEQVQDILVNSKDHASQEVWDSASLLLNALNDAKQEFYSHTQEIISNTIKLIITKLTADLEVQDKMKVLVHQVFEKAKEVENAVLYFHPQDFDNLPDLNIPQNWKTEKDITMTQGWCRLAGAGGEWKTSISFIQRKIIQALNLDDHKNEIIAKNE